MANLRLGKKVYLGPHSFQMINFWFLTISKIQYRSITLFSLFLSLSLKERERGRELIEYLAL
jgi:hypothetical protein